jgi:hypothetical protein
MDYRSLAVSLVTLAACFNPDGGDLETEGPGSDSTTAGSTTANTTVGTTEMTTGASTTQGGSESTSPTSGASVTESSTGDPDTGSTGGTDSTGTTGDVDACPGPYAVDYETALIDVGTGVQGIAAADFDGDGRLDLLLSATSESAVYLLLGTGPGTFAEPVVVPVPNQPARLLAGAIADDNVDFLVEYYNTATNTQNAFRARGVGDGTFYLSTVVGPLRDFEFADLDNDGRLDLVGTEESSVVRRMANASEVYSASSEIVAGTGHVALADLDGDQDVDLVYQSSQFNPASFDVLPGFGDGTFGNSTATLTAGGPSEALAVGDVDGDGNPDVISGTVGGGNTLVEIYLGDGTLAFDNAVQITTVNYNNTIRIADVDADDRQDIVTTHFGIVGAGVSVIRSDGNGGFASAQHFECIEGCNNPRDFAIADFNEDCVLDIIMVSADVNGPVAFLSN